MVHPDQRSAKLLHALPTGLSRLFDLPRLGVIRHLLRIMEGEGDQGRQLLVDHPARVEIGGLRLDPRPGDQIVFAQTALPEVGWIKPQLNPPGPQAVPVYAAPAFPTVSSSGALSSSPGLRNGKAACRASVR